MASLEVVYAAVYPIVNGAVLAALTVLIGIALGRLLGKFVSRILENFRINELVFHVLHARLPAVEASEFIVRYAIYFFFVLLALNTVGVTSWVAYLLGIIVFTGLILSILLAFRDLIPNMIAGFLLHRRRLFRPGDMIKVNNVGGVVIKSGLIETIIRTVKDDILLLPNEYLLQKGVFVKKK